MGRLDGGRCGVGPIRPGADRIAVPQDITDQFTEHLEAAYGISTQRFVGAHLSTYIHTYIHSFIHKYIHTHTRMHAYIHTFILHVYIHAYINTFIRTHTYIYT